MSIRKKPGSRFGMLVKQLDVTYPKFKLSAMAASIGVTSKQLSRWYDGHAEPNFKALAFVRRKYSANLEYLVLGKGDMFLTDADAADAGGDADANYLTADKRRIQELEVLLKEKDKQIRDKERIIALYEERKKK